MFGEINAGFFVILSIDLILSIDFLRLFKNSFFQISLFIWRSFGISSQAADRKNFF